MSNPRNQHQASQAYLRNFANTREQVSVYDRIQKKTFPLVKIRNVASKRDFYTVKDEAGTEDFTFETQMLAKVDGTHQRLMQKLLEPTPSLTDMDRQNFDYIMALQFLRTREGRRFLEDTADFNLRFLLDAQFSSVPEDKRELFIEVQYAGATDEEKDMIQRMVKDPGKRLEFTTREWLLSVVDNLSGAAEELAKRYWLILDSGHEAFLTSDTPVVLIGSDSWGLQVAQFVAWPISPKRIVLRPLHHTWNGQNVVIEETNPERVRELNQAIANKARMQIIWHPDTDPMSSITPPEGEPLIPVGGRHAGPHERPFEVWLKERVRVQEQTAPFILRRKMLDDAITVGLKQLRRRQR